MGIRIAAFADEASATLEGQIRAMERNGIRLLEIRQVETKNISALTRREARQVRERLEEKGMEVWSVGSPTGKIRLGDPFRPHFDAFRHQLELANVLGAAHYRLFSFYDTGDSDSAFDEVCDRLSRMLEAAKGSGVILCHENEKEIFGDRVDRCLRLLTALPELKAVFDPANFLQCGEAALPAWERLAPFVEYLHIKDCDAAGRVVPPGRGVGDLKEILTRYAAAGGGTVTLEPHLSGFVGLAALENGQKSRSAYSFKNGDEAFDAAAGALKELLEGIV